MDLSIASNRMWSKDGERQEETTWVDATVWGKTAESLSNIIKKGTHLTVTGRLKTNSWTTPEGVNRSKLSVNADTISLSPRGKPEAVAVGADDSEVAF
jgi:single-strand DNA-binding protein